MTTKRLSTKGTNHSPTHAGAQEGLSFDEGACSKRVSQSGFSFFYDDPNLRMLVDTGITVLTTLTVTNPSLDTVTWRYTLGVAGDFTKVALGDYLDTSVETALNVANRINLPIVAIDAGFTWVEVTNAAGVAEAVPVVVGLGTVIHRTSHNDSGLGGDLATALRVPKFRPITIYNASGAVAYVAFGDSSVAATGPTDAFPILDGEIAVISSGDNEFLVASGVSVYAYIPEDKYIERGL